jgi:hypothetical protein
MKEQPVLVLFNVGEELKLSFSSSTQGIEFGSAFGCSLALKSHSISSILPSSHHEMVSKCGTRGEHVKTVYICLLTRQYLFL